MSEQGFSLGLWPGINALSNIGAGGGGGYEGPLDLVSGPVAAYSLRALSVNRLNQPMLTIRESGGHTTQTFNADATTGETPSSDITAFLDGADGTVISWSDQSGQARDVLSPETIQNPAPAWSASVPTGNARPGLSFTSNFSTVGASLNTSGPITINASAYTLFAVMKTTFVDPGFQQNGAGTVCGIDYITDNKMSFDVSSAPDGIGGRVDMYDADTGGEIGGLLTSGGFQDVVHVVEIAVGLGQKYAAVDGSEITSDSAYDFDPGISSLSGVFVVGGHDDSHPGNLNCPMLEMILYPLFLSSEDRTLVRENIADYYGITLDAGGGGGGGDIEFREDGGNELREDGSIELREDA